MYRVIKFSIYPGEISFNHTLEVKVESFQVFKFFQRIFDCIGLYFSYMNFFRINFEYFKVNLLSNRSACIWLPLNIPVPPGMTWMSKTNLSS